jgi:hypothetical protein
VPKRTNPFQRLIKIIESQLWSEAELTESAVVGGREIDILIEHRAGGTEFRVAIECRDHQRTQSVQWVDSLIGKYGTRDPSQGVVPVAHKVIAVSSSGFSKSAYEKAQSSDVGLELLTLGEAENVEWGDFEILSRKVPVRRVTFIPSTHIDLNPAPKNVYSAMVLKEYGEPGLDELQLIADSKTKDIQDYILNLVNEKLCPHQLFSHLENNLSKGEGYKSVKVPFSSQDIVLQDQRGGAYELRSARCHYAFIVEVEEISLIEAAYRDARTFSGSEKFFGVEISIAFVEQEDGDGILVSVAVAQDGIEYHWRSNELPFIDGKMSLTMFAIAKATDFSPPKPEHLPDRVAQS